MHDLILSCDGRRIRHFRDLAAAVEGKTDVLLNVFRGFDFDTPD